MLNRILDRFTFGGRLPGGVGTLLSATVLVSLTTALLDRKVGPLFDALALVPDRVLRGEVWRLVTWSLLELDPITLLFACLFLYWFGRDLAQEWGSRRFFLIDMGIAAASAMAVSAASLLDPDLAPRLFVGSWPVTCAVTVAWGLMFPDRTIRIWFVIPIKGIVIGWGTVALTVAFAIYRGWEHVAPHLVGEALMLGYLYRDGPERWLSRHRRAAQQAKRAAVLEKKAAQRRAAESSLYTLEDADDDLPPLPPELEGQLGRIMDEAAKRHRKGGGGTGDPS